MEQQKTETKHCKFCQTEIPQKAKVCSQCGRKQSGKAKWIILVIIALLVLGALAGGGENPSTTEPSAANANPAAENTAGTNSEETPLEIMEISPAELLETYEANEVKGDDIYEGKTMRLSGTVGSIGKDIMEEVYITFAGEDFAITSVQCYFSDEAQIAKVMELQEGDPVTLIGICDGKFGNVLINDCVFE